jgi:hypothetical protein
MGQIIGREATSAAGSPAIFRRLGLSGLFCLPLSNHPTVEALARSCGDQAVSPITFSRAGLARGRWPIAGRGGSGRLSVSARAAKSPAVAGLQLPEERNQPVVIAAAGRTITMRAFGAPVNSSPQATTNHTACAVGAAYDELGRRGEPQVHGAPRRQVRDQNCRWPEPMDLDSSHTAQTTGRLDWRRQARRNSRG